LDQKTQENLQSSGQPAQSASEKTLSKTEDDLLNVRPLFIVPLMYLKILFTAVQCEVIGACKNGQTLLTEKDISGLVKVKYCNAPTMLMYCVLSSGPRGSP
jgi:hypothetical protein